MHAKHPSIAARWDRKYGSKLSGSNRKSIRHAEMGRVLDKELGGKS